MLPLLPSRGCPADARRWRRRCARTSRTLPELLEREPAARAPAARGRPRGVVAGAPRPTSSACSVDRAHRLSGRDGGPRRPHRGGPVARRRGARLGRARARARPRSSAGRAARWGSPGPSPRRPSRSASATRAPGIPSRTWTSTAWTGSGPRSRACWRTTSRPTPSRSSSGRVRSTASSPRRPSPASASPPGWSCATPAATQREVSVDGGRRRIVGFDSATPRLTVAAVRGRRGALRARLRARRRESARRTRGSCWRSVEEAAAAAGGWSAVAAIAVGHRPRARTPGFGSGSLPRAGSRRRWARRSSRWAPWRRSPRGSAGPTGGRSAVLAGDRRPPQAGVRRPLRRRRRDGVGAVRRAPG